MTNSELRPHYDYAVRGCDCVGCHGEPTLDELLEAALDELVSAVEATAKTEH